MIKKSLRAYISRSQFVFAVLLDREVVRVTGFQLVEHDIHGVLEGFIVLSGFRGIDHFEQGSVSGRRRACAALSGRHLRLWRSGRSGTGAYHAAGDLGQHRAIASLRFAGSFPPILRFEKFEIHTVFLHFPNLDLTKNLSPNLLAELCGAALDKNRIHRRWMRFCVIRKAPAHEEACRIARLRVPFAAPREALTNSSPDSSRSAPLSAEPRADARL